MSDRSIDEVTRRRFLQGAAAVGVGSMAGALNAQAAEAKPKFPTNPLGRTKLQVTKVSYGSLNTAGGGGQALIKASLQAGVNMLHTSSTYKGGNTIKAVGEFFGKNKGIRDTLTLCLKGSKTRTSALASELDDMLKALHTDHCDVYLPVLHNPSKRQLEGLMKFQDDLKKQGKIKFVGFVCHGALNPVLEMVHAEAPDYFDATLISTKMVVAAARGEKGEAAKFVENLDKLRKKGLGVISMKSQAREAMAKGPETFQAHCKTLLARSCDTVVYTFATLQQVGNLEKLDLTTTAMAPWERHLADRFHSGRDFQEACLMCSRCTEACPQNMPVNDLMRIRMYHDDHRDCGYARESYRELGGDLAAQADNCGSCTACRDACPVGLANADRVKYVTSLFA